MNTQMYHIQYSSRKKCHLCKLFLCSIYSVHQIICSIVQIKPHIVYYNLFQYAKQKKVEIDVPAIKIAKTDDEVTKEIIETSLRRALTQQASLQAPDGHWPAEYSGVLFVMPIMVETKLRLAI